MENKILEYLAENKDGVSFEQIRADVFGVFCRDDYSKNLDITNALFELKANGKISWRDIDGSERYFPKTT